MRSPSPGADGREPVDTAGDGTGIVVGGELAIGASVAAGATGVTVGAGVEAGAGTVVEFKLVVDERGVAAGAEADPAVVELAVTFTEPPGASVS